MNEFWIILTGSLIAVSCGLLGCYLILRQMAMMGDAISHAVLPGIFFAFLIAGHGSIPSLIGASVLGIITAFMIETFSRKAKLQSDAAIGLTFTLLFAIGVILIAAYAQQVDLDQECVLYGEIAFVPFDTFDYKGMSLGPRAVWIGGVVLTLIIAMIVVGYKGLFLTTFDPAYAAALGFSTAFWHYLLMAAVSLTTVVSFESVGAILVVAFLIGPAATAYLLTNRFEVMLILSAIIGVLTAISGYYLAVWLNGSIAGAMAAMVGFWFLLAFLFSPIQGVFRYRKEPLAYVEEGS